MKVIDKFLWILGFILIGFMIGATVSEPQKCMSVCAELFEKMAC